MPPTILGRKIGLTRLHDGSGKNVPVTVIAAGPCYVSQVKTAETDGYDAVQLAFEPVKARNTTVPQIGHDAAAGLTPKRVHREFRLAAGEAQGYQPGEELTVERFEAVRFVDVTARSKGKGFAGVMKRHHFRGLGGSHGVERKHRSSGSVGGRSSNLGGGSPKKGIRMAGHMGDAKVTIRSLELFGIDKQKNLLLVKGPVPGPKRALVLIRQAKRLYKRKAKLVQAS